MVLQAPPDPREETPVEQTPSEIRNSELAQWRKQVIADLRAFADDLERTDIAQMPTPYVSFSLYSIDTPTDDDPYNTTPITTETVRAAMAASPGQWRKYRSSDTFWYSKTYGSSCRVYYNVGSDAVCRRVQVGTRHVEAKPAHDEPVYEWQCDTAEPEVSDE